MGANIITLLSVISILSLLIAVIIFLHFVQKVFERDGIIWGIISALYPIGTYLYCRKNWAAYRKPFVITSALLVGSLVLWLLVRLVK